MLLVQWVYIANWIPASECLAAALKDTKTSTAAFVLVPNIVVELYFFRCSMTLDDTQKLLTMEISLIETDLAQRFKWNKIKYK